jgi:hypothetical protein
MFLRYLEEAVAMIWLRGHGCQRRSAGRRTKNPMYPEVDQIKNRTIMILGLDIAILHQ